MADKNGNYRKEFEMSRKEKNSSIRRKLKIKVIKSNYSLLISLLSDTINSLLIALHETL